MTESVVEIFDVSVKGSDLVVDLLIVTVSVDIVGFSVVIFDMVVDLIVEVCISEVFCSVTKPADDDSDKNLEVVVDSTMLEVVSGKVAEVVVSLDDVSEFVVDSTIVVRLSVILDGVIDIVVNLVEVSISGKLCVVIVVSLKVIG